MPIYNGTFSQTLTSGGGTINLTVADPTITKYELKGSTTLTGSWTIQPTGTPAHGMEFDIRYQADITLDGNNITIFGVPLTEAQAVSDLTITAFYDGSVWDVDIIDNALAPTNGVTYIGSRFGLGGSLAQDTQIDKSGNTIEITDESFSFVMGEKEIVPTVNVPYSGFFYNESAGNIAMFGRVDSTSLGGSDEFVARFAETSGDTSRGLSIGSSRMALEYADSVNTVSNGVVIRPDRVFLSVYRPDGSAQFGFNAFDGTDIIAECADHYAWDPALNLDIALVQTTMSHVNQRFAYNTTPGSEEYNRTILDSNGFTIECSGGEVDDKFVRIVGMLQNFSNDSAAASGGVPVNGLYRNGSVVMIRVS